MERELEKEYINTGGWLKPNKMIEFTGKNEKIPAKEYKERKNISSMQPPVQSKKLVKKTNSSHSVPGKGLDPKVQKKSQFSQQDTVKPKLPLPGKQKTERDLKSQKF